MASTTDLVPVHPMETYRASKDYALFEAKEIHPFMHAARNRASLFKESRLPLCKGTVHFQHRLRHGVATPAVAVQHRLRHGHATPAVAAQLRLHLQITSSSSASLRSLSLPTVQSFLTHT